MFFYKKSLGQNFLTSRKVVDDILDAADVKENDTVLEVGPGKGILTEALLEKAGKVVAVEKDERLREFLEEKFAKEIKNGKLELIFGDALHYQGVALMGGYKVVANIPYYITSNFLRKFLSDKSEGEQPSSMVLMIQKEVAERIVGTMTSEQNSSRFTLPPSAVGSDATQNFARWSLRKTKESLLSLSVKAYGEPKIIRRVAAGNFSPTPKVDSAIIKISGISKNFFKNVSEEDFFKIIKKGFSSKRKMLKGNLGVSGDVLNSCDIEDKARAENVQIDKWKCLVRKLSTENNNFMY